MEIITTKTEIGDGHIERTSNASHCIEIRIYGLKNYDQRWSHWAIHFWQNLDIRFSMAYTSLWDTVKGHLPDLKEKNPFTTYSGLLQALRFFTTYTYARQRYSPQGIVMAESTKYH